MRFPTDKEVETTEQPTIYSANPGSQWMFHTLGEQMVWEVVCPALGHSVEILNRVQVILLMDETRPEISGRYFYIPKLDSPLFYSLRAAARYAANFEFVIQEEVA